MLRIKRWAAAAALTAAAAAQDVRIGPRSVLVVDPREPVAVQRAAQDLASDMEKVFGARPRFVEKQEDAGAGAVIVSCRYNLPPGVSRPAEMEAFRIAAAQGRVALAGADMRGTIYALYGFAQRFLGVDPLHFWTDHDPPRRAEVRVPAGTDIAEGSPVFRHRGWFINDEDLLTGWKPAAPGRTGISLEAWDRVFEALLRLKGNMIVPGTFIFPNEPQVKAASERGLIITQHHIEVLGTNTWRWPDSAPYSFRQRPQVLINAWRNAMRGYAPEQEVIWTVGYRGRHDRPFWEDDASIPATGEARSQAIREAIDKQVELVRAERRDPRFIMNAWMEAVPLIQQGLLKLPQGVALVWPDNGHGVIRDGGRISRGQGVYYHTAMHDFVANQLSEMVPLERIEREIGRAADAGATEYLLVNVSDVRPYPLTTRAVMEMAARGRKWDARSFLAQWCREEFGGKAAAAAAGYYRAYFAAPGQTGPAEHETLADNAYQNYLRYILVSLIKGRPELSSRFIRVANWDDFIQRTSRAAREAEPRWAEARTLAGKAAALVPADRRQFFQAHVLTQLEINARGNRALLLGTEAWTDRSRAAENVAAIIAELKGILAAFDAAEYGKWRGFYKEDRFANVRQTLGLAEGAAAVLSGRPVPAGLRVEALPVDPYFWLKSYQAEMWVDVR
jgi:hypothetical protein